MESAHEILIGQTLELSGPDPTAARHNSRGAVVIENGKIARVGPADDILRAHPNLPQTDYGTALILPGFIDTHVHYPQTAIIASWGKRLIDWLDQYTFPEEMRFEDPDYAAHAARLFFDLSLGAGTTTVCSYATSHPASVTAFFEEANRRGLRAMAGKSCMDRNAPHALCDTAQRAYDESKALIETWHGKNRLCYAITPRFTPTSTTEQLNALGALWAEHPDCAMQTHISEQTDEVAWVAELCPDARDYLDTYDRAGLLGKGAIFGHAIHLTAREIARLQDTGAAIAHCPTSNTFIGSGLFDMKLAETIAVGLATDTGGGSSFSMLRTMAAAYEIAQLRGNALHPANLLWRATGGAADVLGFAGKIGQLAPGAEADLAILDLASTPVIAQRAARAGDIWEALFPTIMMGDDRAIRDVRIQGRSTGSSPC